MPLDDMGNRLALEANLVKEIPDPLTALGITPIPREQAELHKVKETKEFAAKSRHNRRLVENGQAFWCDFIMPTTFVDPKTLIRRLNRAIYNHIDNYSEMPKDVCKLVQTVNASIKDATFSIEYFFEDPIINVHYIDADGTAHDDCLAIWKNGTTLAIAEMKHPPPRRRFWLFGR